MFNDIRNGRSNSQQSSEEGAIAPPTAPEQGTSLDWDTRIQYFVGFFILSIIAGFLGSALLVSMKLTGFCVLTSISSVLSLVGTCFLSGPTSQIKRMFDNNRWIASLIYLLSIAATLFAGLALKNPPLAITFVVIQYIAMAWYSLSYIPYGRQMVSRVLCSCF